MDNSEGYGEPLADFIAFFQTGRLGADGLLDIAVRVMPEEKYNAIPLTDRAQQKLRFVVYAPAGAMADTNGDARKEAIARILSTAQLKGTMGDGKGAGPEGNTDKGGHRESNDITKTTEVTPAKKRVVR